MRGRIASLTGVSSIWESVQAEQTCESTSIAVFSVNINPELLSLTTPPFV